MRGQQEMLVNNFELNEYTLSVIEEIGGHMPGGFFIYKAAEPEELIYANKEVIRIFGCADLDEFKELTGFTFKGMVYPADYDSISASIVQQIDSSDDHMDYAEYRITRKDGKVRWVDDYGHYCDTKAYGGIYVVFISDITEKKEQIQTDQATRDAVISTLTNAYNTVWLIKDVVTEKCSLYHTDLDAVHSEAIRNALSHARYSETKTEYVATMVAEEDRERMQEQISLPYILKQFETKDQFSVGFLRELSSGERHYRIDFGKVLMPGGKIGVTMGFKDIEEEVRLEQKIQQQLAEALSVAEEANKAKTIFLSNMSHEIRTPMNAIIGLDNIALNDPTISETTKNYLIKIGISAHHLLGIINDILDMSRIESGRMIIKNEEFSFARVLAQVNGIISDQCKDRGLDYECRVKGKVDDYYIGDDMKLRQVMLNLLGNAVKFTPKGGNILFVVEGTAHLEGKSTLRLTVSDTGIGMSKEYLPRIFEPFSQEDSSSTNRYGSTGLGMPITKSIVELMNGHIEVKSEKGKGTTFTVTVTLLDCDRKAATDEDMPHPEEICVLVIDDDPIACEHAQVILGQVGISCEKALSGSDGLEMVKLRHARREPYNLILVDWKMPDIDGLETTRQIRTAVGDETPIIILTSFSWEDIADEAKAAGVDTFVAKPLFAGSVLDEFREAFKKKNARLIKETADLTGRRILLTEDMPINAEIMMMVLAMREMEVDHAENGQVAVEKYALHEPGYYSAILMDIRMPVMDGLEATRTIRAMDRDDAKTIPIIALTANAFDEDVQRSMQAGLNAHLSKPVEPETLFKTLEELIKL
jgi:PAS domain S-box-containing protein